MKHLLPNFLGAAIAPLARAHVSPGAANAAKNFKFIEKCHPMAKGEKLTGALTHKHSTV